VFAARLLRLQAPVRIFHCDHCENLVFFENTHCLGCGHVLAFLPDVMEIGSLDPAGEGLWQSPNPAAGGRTYRLCANYSGAQVCNWAVDVRRDDTLCEVCQLTTTIPDPTVEGHQAAWAKLEAAKRRLVYTLLNLRLATEPRSRDPRGLAFEFLADPVDGQPPILTGHDGGVITIALAEADDAERERRRMLFGEFYRTLLGHFRHEIGHYYWDRLVSGTEWLERFRELFGDEQADYAAALKANYDNGPPADWRDRHISSYASTHPWEDWAETWAHFMHIQDSLDTAMSFGLTGNRILGEVEPYSMEDLYAPDDPDAEHLLMMLNAWLGMTTVLNELARSMGQQDFYPFVMSRPVVKKLQFIQLVSRQARATAA